MSIGFTFDMSTGKSTIEIDNILPEMYDFMQYFAQFCVKTVQELIADFQDKRFNNQGQINGHARWYDNSPQVIKDKGRNKPLIDSGNLLKEMTTPDNWNVETIFTGNALTFSIPEQADFTSSKYDILQTGGKVDSYVSPRKNYINIKSVGARDFKSLTSQDIDLITEQLALKIQEEFA